MAVRRTLSGLAVAACLGTLLVAAREQAAGEQAEGEAEGEAEEQPEQEGHGGDRVTRVRQD